MITIKTFAVGRRVPVPCDYLIDVRGMDNPHSQFPTLDGRDTGVKAFMLRHNGQQIYNIIRQYVDTPDGKTIGIMCGHGKHRSVAVAELLAEILIKRGRYVNIHHLELEGK